MDSDMLKQIASDVTSDVMKAPFEEMLIVKDGSEVELIKIPVIWYEKFAEELLKRLKK
jgi:hypothetical protein